MPFAALRPAAFAVAAFALACGAATANPGEANDVVGQYLADHGLTPPARTAAPVADATAPKPSILRAARDGASELVFEAMGYLGIRYKRGGNSAETGFDCSGFVRHVFNASLGVVLPRRADEQAATPELVKVERADLKPGDLVFFNTMRRTFSHVGIYIGENRFIHSPRTGEEIRTEDMGFAYWARRFTGARRVVEAPAASLAPMPSTVPTPATTPAPAS